jgi:hypothetical protein
VQDFAENVLIDGLELRKIVLVYHKYVILAMIVICRDIVRSN